MVQAPQRHRPCPAHRVPDGSVCFRRDLCSSPTLDHRCIMATRQLWPWALFCLQRREVHRKDHPRLWGTPVRPSRLLQRLTCTKRDARANRRKGTRRHRARLIICRPPETSFVKLSLSHTPDIVLFRCLLTIITLKHVELTLRSIAIVFFFFSS